MSNEEKILQALERLQEDVTHLKITQENVTNKNIQLIMEAQTDTNRKIDQLQAAVDNMAPTVTALDVLHQMRKGAANE